MVVFGGKDSSKQFPCHFANGLVHLFPFPLCRCGVRFCRRTISGSFIASRVVQVLVPIRIREPRQEPRVIRLRIKPEMSMCQGFRRRDPLRWIIQQHRLQKINGIRCRRCEKIRKMWSREVFVLCVVRELGHPRPVLFRRRSQRPEYRRKLAYLPFAGQIRSPEHELGENTANGPNVDSVAVLFRAK